MVEIHLTSAGIHWTAYVTALLVPVVALIAAYIAYAQWKTARNKLRFELFEKRFAVYRGVCDLLGSIVCNGKVSDVALQEYLRATSNAKWVVSSDVAKYLEEEVYKPAILLQCLDAEIEGTQRGEERTQKISKRTSLTIQFSKLQERIDSEFEEHLRLRH